MRAVMLMFDSLNRHFLPNYGCTWTKLPNFRRLAEKTLTFDRFYAGSMPCMPARREMHTGRYSFLHRFWSPLEPFDESVIRNLRERGVYTHIVTDHFHYWEDGGSGYLTKFDSHEMIRGQQGDPWIGQVARPGFPATLSRRSGTENWRHDRVNRAFLDREEKMPQAQVFAQAQDFIERNAGEDRWFLQIEAFDPHEPFYSQAEYKQLYDDPYAGKELDWPDYGYNDYGAEATAHVRREYAALLSMCDRYLGALLDQFDRLDLWRDTLLIVNTDHGFLLGEHQMMGKNVMPWYEELVHLPFFLYDPRFPELRGQRRTALAQTIDLVPTLAEFFGADCPRYAQGKSMTPIVREDVPIREAALFGIHGGHINVTDGRYVYMRAPQTRENAPLYEYTLMPNHMNCPFSPAELRGTELTGFSFTRGAKVMKIPSAGAVGTAYDIGNLFFDLERDPRQERPCRNSEEERRLLALMRQEMHAHEAPREQYERIGLPAEGEITERILECPHDTHSSEEGKEAVCLTPAARQLWRAARAQLGEGARRRCALALEAAARVSEGKTEEAGLFGILRETAPEEWNEDGERRLRLIAAAWGTMFEEEG